MFCWFILRGGVMRRRILPMAMEQTNRAPKKEAIWYQNSLTSTTRGWRGLPLVRRGSCLGGNYNGLQMIDWLMATAPGQRITFLRPNSGTQLNATQRNDAPNTTP